MNARNHHHASAAAIDRLRRFIVEELGWRGGPVSADFPLIENRVIDSLGLFRIVTFLEMEYGIKIPDQKVVPANFSSLGTIATLVEEPS